MTDPSCLSEREIEGYLRSRVPLAAAMGLTVRAADARRVELVAPLIPNINHAETVFGGSAVALAILAAWTLLYVRETARGSHAQLLIQRSLMTYERPISGDFQAVCELTDESSYQRFQTMLERHGRARITLQSILLHEAARAASFEGDFVALRAPLREPR
jgi:thioesterase domain-containing protein